MAAKTKRARSNAAKKAAKTRKQNSAKNARRAAAAKAIKTIETSGSSEEFILKKLVFASLSTKSHGKYKCKCCQNYFEPHFLAIDHIRGRKKISKIKALKDINYSEKRGGKALRSWINKYSDKKIIHQHFQVLCFNCNVAKFLYKTCPHQR